MPYLLALATASNIGSVMTVTGNPQNMLIGIYSKIPYLSFFGALFPVTIIGSPGEHRRDTVRVPEGPGWASVHASRQCPPLT